MSGAMGSWNIAGTTSTGAGLNGANWDIDTVTTWLVGPGIMSTGVAVAATAVFVTSGITIVGEDTGGMVELGMASTTGEDGVGEILWLLQATKKPMDTTRTNNAGTFDSCFMEKNLPFWVICERDQSLHRTHNMPTINIVYGKIGSMKGRLMYLASVFWHRMEPWA